MEKEDFLYAVQDSGESEKNNFTIRETIDLILYNWQWFVLSIVLCMVVAVIYVKKSPKVYTSSTTILIKEDNKTNTQALTEGKAFSDLVGLNIINNVDNEVYVLTSKRLMSKVVERLKLDVDYSIRRELRYNSMYQCSPIECAFSDDIKDLTMSFEVTLLESGKIVLHDFVYSDIAKDAYKDLEINAHCGDTIEMPIGKVTISSTVFLNEDMIGKDILVSKTTVDASAAAYCRKIKTEIGKNTSVIVVSIEDHDALRIKDILNTLVKVYNEDAVSDKQKIILNTADFIVERLNILGAELSDVDENIEAFKKENQLYDISSEVTLNLSESSRYKGESVELQNEIAMAKYISSYLKDNEHASSLIPVNTGISIGAINALISNYNDLLLQREKLAAASSDHNPTVQDLNKMLQERRKSIVSSLDNAIQTLQIQLDNMVLQERQVKGNILQIPTQEKEIVSIERQQKIKAELYLYLLQKREENSLSLSFVDDNARVIDYADNGILVSPNKKQIVMLALIIGLILPVIVFFLYSIINTKIRGIKDLENLQIPFIGSILLSPDSKDEKLNIVVKENGKNYLSESFRVLRSNLRFMLDNIGQNTAHVFMVTSSDPFSGKTYISSNLAISIAQSDKKVVLLDFDLRKRSLTRMLHGKNSSQGISEYLSGEINNIDEIIVKGCIHERLDVIFAGMQPPNPSELLLSERLDDLIKELKQRYDFVILDTIPIINLADVYIINRVADLTIFILREGMSDRRQLPEITKMYSDKRLNNMCIVLNGVSEKKVGSGYHYKYSYKYGYGYGYGYGYSYDYLYQDQDGTGKKRKIRRRRHK